MVKYLSIIFTLLLLNACGSSNGRSNNTTEEYTEEQIVEDCDAAKKQGYNKGYEDGKNDGVGLEAHGESFDDRNSYQTEDADRAYKNGYRDGYDEGYSDGDDMAREARDNARKRNDWHNWDDEDVDGLYVLLDGVEDDDVAREIAREDYEGEYIREWGMYFAKISQPWGEYEITLGEKVCSNLYKIRGNDIYIHFKWGLPEVSSGDEGVLDWSGTFSSFYKKPDDL